MAGRDIETPSPRYAAGPSLQGTAAAACSPKSFWGQIFVLRRVVQCETPQAFESRDNLFSHEPDHTGTQVDLSPRVSMPSGFGPGEIYFWQY